MSSFFEVRTMKEFWAPEAGGLQRVLPGLRRKYGGLAESVHGAQPTGPQGCVCDTLLFGMCLQASDSSVAGPRRWRKML